MSMPGGSRWYLRMWSTRSWTPSSVFERLAAVAHQHDALHDVGLVVLADDAEPRRVRRPATVRHVAHAHRHALRAAATTIVADVAQRPDEADAAHVERLLAEREALPADVLVRVRERVDELLQRQRRGP